MAGKLLLTNTKRYAVHSPSPPTPAPPCAGDTVVERTCLHFIDGGRTLRVCLSIATVGPKPSLEETKPAISSLVAAVIAPPLAPEAASEAMLHIQTAQKQESIRNQLGPLGGVGFVADGAILPRLRTAAAQDHSPTSESPDGAANKHQHSTPTTSDSPVQAHGDGREAQPPTIIPFTSPDSLAVTLDVTFTCHSTGSTLTQQVRGMLVKRGVTLIAGGGFHGKSTLLEAIAGGVYDRCPGDGRELVITDATALTVRAEDGRSVQAVDISPFVNQLPSSSRLDPAHFHTHCASGSTSQAAGVMEAIEAGAKTLIFDEDTCAANFMSRDGRMRSLVCREPITPLLYRVNHMYSQLGVSSVVVVGGNGDWLDVGETVILLDDYRAQDATARAAYVSKVFSHGHIQFKGQGVAHRLPWPEEAIKLARFPRIASAFLLQDEKDQVKERGSAGHIAAMHGIVDTEAEGQVLVFRRAGESLQVQRHLAQLLVEDDGQLCRGAGWALTLLSRVQADPSSGEASHLSVNGLLDKYAEILADEAVLEPQLVFAAPLDIAVPRPVDVATLINRLRGVRFKQHQPRPKTQGKRLSSDELQAMWKRRRGGAVSAGASGAANSD